MWSLWPFISRPMHLWKLFPLVFSELCRRQEHCELLKRGVLVLLFSLRGSQHTCGCRKAITTVIICILAPKLLALLWKFNLVKSWLLFMPRLNCSVFLWALPNQQHGLERLLSRVQSSFIQMHIMRGCERNGWVRHSLPFVTAYVRLSKWPYDESSVLEEYLWKLFGTTITKWIFNCCGIKHYLSLFAQCDWPHFSCQALPKSHCGCAHMDGFQSHVTASSQPCFWPSLLLLLTWALGWILVLVHCLPSQGLSDPHYLLLGTGTMGEGRVCTDHVQLLAWLSPWGSCPLLSPRWDHPVSTVSSNG